MTKSTFEMTAAQLRAARVLWPESLSNEELAADVAYLLTRADTMPISLRMAEREAALREKA